MEEKNERRNAYLNLPNTQELHALLAAIDSESVPAMPETIDTGSAIPETIYAGSAIPETLPADVSLLETIPAVVSLLETITADFPAFWAASAARTT